MRTSRTITDSVWTVDIIRAKKKPERRIVDKVLVTGNDIRKISKNSIYVGRVYKSIFGKGWQDKIDKVTLKIIKIELGQTYGESFAQDDDPIFK
jgi:hypothetical protein